MKTPIKIRGIRYPTKTAAAKALGMSYSAFMRRQQLGIRFTKPIDKARRPYPKRVRVRGRWYPSQTAAAKAIGMKFTTLTHRIKSGIPLTKKLLFTRSSKRGKR